jgi:hypothetical protein
LYCDRVLDAKIIKVSDTEIGGYRFSEAWASDQRLYFSIKTSHSFKDVLQSPVKKGLAGAQKIALHFINPKNEVVILKVGIFAGDIERAK